MVHVSKVEFLIAFKAVFLASMKEADIKAGFKASGLAPRDPETVLLKLDVKICATTPPESISVHMQFLLTYFPLFFRWLRKR